MLTIKAVQNAKPRPRAHKLSDEKGLYLLVNPNGSKYWRYKYRFAGKEKVLALGVYDDVSLADARERRDDSRRLLTRGVDPGVAKKVNRAAVSQAATNSFEAVAREWYAKHVHRWGSGHAKTIIRRLERDVFPWIGERAVSDVTSDELLKVLNRIVDRGALETAHRVYQVCGQVFLYAQATGRTERDPARPLRRALAPSSPKHYPTLIEPKAVGDLLRAIDGYMGSFPTKCALRLAPLLFVRPGELRQAEWVEIDLDSAEWRIPADKMKANRLHFVPLPEQAVAILRELQPLTGHARYVFPGVRSRQRPMSANTINAALRRLGYDKHTMTAHGFRAMASTILNEQGWNRDVIERQLAHGEPSKVRAAYNYAEHLNDRRQMMQSWADYLDGLAARANVVPIRMGA